MLKWIHIGGFFHIAIAGRYGIGSLKEVFWNISLQALRPAGTRRFSTGEISCALVAATGADRLRPGSTEVPIYPAHSSTSLSNSSLIRCSMAISVSRACATSGDDCLASRFARAAVIRESISLASRIACLAISRHHSSRISSNCESFMTLMFAP